MWIFTYFFFISLVKKTRLVQLDKPAEVQPEQTKVKQGEIQRLDNYRQIQVRTKIFICQELVQAVFTIRDEHN